MLRGNWLVFASVLISLGALISANSIISEQSFSRPLRLDEGYNLEVPFQLLHQHLYASFGGPGLAYKESQTSHYQFNHWITTGPTMLLPVAWLSKLSGISVSMAGKVVSYISFGMLTAFLVGFLASGGTSIVSLVALAIASVCIGFTLTREISLENGIVVLGEISSIFYYLLGLVFYDRRKTGRAGVFWSLSALTKVVMSGVIALTLVFDLIVLSSIHRGRERLSTQRGRWFLIAGFLAPQLIWQCYQLVSFRSFPDYLQSFSYYIKFIADLGVVHLGEDKKTLSTHLVSMISVVAGGLYSHLSILLIALIGNILLAGKFVGMIRKPGISPAPDDVWLQVQFASFVMQCYFIFLSREPWSRRFYPFALLFVISGLGHLLSIVRRWEVGNLAISPRVAWRTCTMVLAVFAVILFASIPSEPFGELKSQLEGQKRLLRFAQTYDARWISQSKDPFDFGHELLLETGQRPWVVFPWIEGGMCGAFRPDPGVVYGVLVYRELPEGPKWACREGRAIDSFILDRFSYQGCRGIDLFCGKGPGV